MSIWEYVNGRSLLPESWHCDATVSAAVLFAGWWRLRCARAASALILSLEHWHYDTWTMKANDLFFAEQE